MAALLEAYITNLGRYAEDGVEAGATLKFPATTEALQSLLKRIGVDGVRYEEIFITSFDGDVLGLHEHLGEYENLDELNHLAHLLSELEQDELEKFEAALTIGNHTSSVAEIINLAQNLDCFEFYPDIENEEELGRYYTDDLPIPAELKDYFDYEAYGRDAATNEGGHFALGGYIVQTSSNFKEYYHDTKDIPAEHRIFAYPQLSIREQMAAYKEIIDRSALDNEKRRINTGREDR